VHRLLDLLLMRLDRLAQAERRSRSAQVLVLVERALFGPGDRGYQAGPEVRGEP